MQINTESIREAVRRTLDELGFEDATPLDDTMLTLAGYNVGREFRFTSVRAVWMASQGQIKFYGDDGAVLRVMDLSEPRQAKVA